MQTLTITCPDDFHLHLRDGAMMRAVIPDSARQFARAIIMPNLNPPIVTAAQALDYRERIKSALPAGSRFEPMMTLYLTDNTTADEIHAANESAHIYAVKYYPAGATTNSEYGVTSIARVYSILEIMEELRLPLLMHGEVTDADIDIFDREHVFIERVLDPLMQRFVNLPVVFEHITTRQAVEFIKQGPDNLAATITPQHLLLNRNALLAGGIQPHHYCLPILQAEQHREAIVAAAISGHPRFFLGTDSAPHARRAKESACGCAGIYSAHSAIELYAQIFEQAGSLDRLENFASRFGADFYGLPQNNGSITLHKADWTIPAELPYGEDTLIPFWSGQTCHWKLK
jgi:dihydroorotase